MRRTHGSEGAGAQQCAPATQLGDQHFSDPTPDPGGGHHQLHDVGDRAQQHLDLAIGVSDRGLQEVDVGEHLRDQQTVVLESEPVGQRLAQRRDLRPQPALRQLGQHGRVLLASQQRGQDRPAGLAQDRRGNRGELDPGVLQHLLQALDRARAFLGEPAAVAGQIAQQADIARWHETRRHQSVFEQLRDPHRVRHIGLAARNVPQVLGVDHPHREMVLQHVVDRLPINTGGFHPDQRHLLGGQPVRHLFESTGHRGKRPGLRTSGTARSRAAHRGHHRVAVHVQPSAPLDQHIHPAPLPLMAGAARKGTCRSRN